MADSDKNIVITPNIGQTAQPFIVFTGQDAQDITLSVLDSAGLSISGSTGQLFSVIDSTSGTIFSVNDVSGIPSIEVDDDGTIRLAEFAGNILIGTATDNGTDLLQVDGSISASSMSATTFTGALSGNAATASTLQTARTISLGGVLSGSASFNGGSNITITAAHTSDPVITLTGAVTGSGTMTNLGSVSIATTATADPTLTLAGDASGSATFTNLGNATLTVTVADDSHNHIISNVDGLQTALDAKLASSSYTASDVLTKIKTVDGSGSGLDADTLDGIQGSSFLRSDTDDTFSGTSLSFGSSTRQMLNLWSTIYGLGVQNGTFYARTGNRFSIHAGGTHTNTENDPGTGGTNLFTVWSNGIQFIGNTMWHAGNDGSGSGLDADLLDGQQGSYYQPASSALTTSTTFGGDVSGTYNAIVVANDSHTHDTRYYTESEIDTKLTNGTVTKINNNTQNHTGNFHMFVNDGGGNIGMRWNSTTGGTNNLVENGIAYELEIGNDSTVGNFIIHKGSTATGSSGEQITWIQAFKIEGSNSELYAYGNKIWHAGNDGSGSGLDADTLDGLQATDFVRINSTSGNSNDYLHISRNSTNATLYVNNIGTGDIARFFKGSASSSTSGTNQVTIANDGSITATGDINTTSDARVKDNVEVIENAVDKVKQISGVTFTRTDKENTERRYAGVIAQEVQKVLPEVIGGDEDNLTVAYGNMVGLLIEAIKEQQKQIEELKGMIQ